nr:hypothetical protein Ade03nite_91540 [Actinoplanes derwentensis]
MYVDVGYLLSASAVRVTGTSLRNGIQVDYEGAVALFDRETCSAWPGGGSQIAVASSVNAAATRCRDGVSVAIS